MNMKNILYAITLAFFAVIPAIPAYAQDEKTSSATHFSDLPMDTRIQKLRLYLESMSSPLSEYAHFIVSEADRVNIDWRLVTAIAGVESTFGKHIPTDSYNAWGWAVYTGQQDGKHFNSWKDGINVVSEGLKMNYINRGMDTVEKMSSTYAASPTWSWKVSYFINQIDSFNPKKSSLFDVML